MAFICKTCKRKGDPKYVNCRKCRDYIDSLEYRINFDENLTFNKDVSPIYTWKDKFGKDKSVDAYFPSSPVYIKMTGCRIYVRENKYGQLQVNVSVEATNDRCEFVDIMNAIADNNKVDFPIHITERIFFNAAYFPKDIKERIIEKKNFETEQTVIMTPILKETKKGIKLHLLVKEYFPDGIKTHLRRK